jgi:hypothetical protein
MANQLQTTCENLRSIVGTGRAGCGRRLVSPAFVGCISGLGLREPKQHLFHVLERLLHVRVEWVAGLRFPEALQRI